MTEREYPRWVHRTGKESVLVETAEEESATLAAWDATDSQASIAQAWADDDAAIPIALTMPPRKGGWPKGKPRSPKQPAVN